MGKSKGAKKGNTPSTEQSVSSRFSSEEEVETVALNQRNTYYERDENPFLESSPEAETLPKETINTKEKENERRETQAKLGKKQGITIATWNTRGKNDEQKKSKWKQIKRIMHLKRIAVLAVQESRVTKEEATKIENENPGIKILNNGEYTNKLGTLFAINKRIIDDEKEGMLTHQIIIPNRVAQLNLKWGENQVLNMINIYAPNEPKEKEEFYKDLTKRLKKRKKPTAY